MALRGSDVTVQFRGTGVFAFHSPMTVHAKKVTEKTAQEVWGGEWKAALISACPDEWLAAPVEATTRAEAVPALLASVHTEKLCRHMQAAVKPGEHVCSFCGLVNGEFFGAGPRSS